MLSRIHTHTHTHRLTRARRTQVHYGRASLAAVSQLPVHYVFPRVGLNTHQAAQDIAAALAGLPPPSPPCQQQPSFPSSTEGPAAARETATVEKSAGAGARAVLLLDQGYLYALETLVQGLMHLLPPVSRR